MSWLSNPVLTTFLSLMVCVSTGPSSDLTIGNPTDGNPDPYQNLPPCSGKTSKICGEAVDASKGCKLLNGVCQGEILSDPYALVLAPGQPENNYKMTHFFAVCHYQFACKKHWFWNKCVMGDKVGDSMVQRVESGGDCSIKKVQTEPIE
jgi:hypothetical protein